MEPIAVTFVVIGGVGIAVLALSLLAGDLLHLGHADVDGPFSLAAVAAFIGGFGFGGATAAALLPGPGPLWAALAAGTVAAVPLAWVASRLVRAAVTMPTDATPTRGDVIGALGVVVTPIPGEGYGEVRLRLAGQPVKFNAKADRPLPAGARVFVVDAPSATSVVVEETL
jgi:membrane protein implicated in regulation of membrane protease activity